MSQHPTAADQPPIAICGGRGTVQAVPLGSDNVGWILACTTTGAAALIDGPEAGPYLEALDARQLHLTTLWTTHTHGDHIGLHRDLARRGMLGGLEVVACRERAADVPGATTFVDHGDAVALGALQARVLRLEGHQRGHLGFFVEAAAGETGALFCGDTLFGAGCGYLFDGPAEAMHASLTTISALPPATLVCCAHEYTWDNLRFALSIEPNHAPLRQRVITSHADLAAKRGTLPSTIGLERETNPFLRLSSPNVLLFLDNHTSLDADAAPAERFAALRLLKDQKRYRELVTDEEMAAVVASRENS